MAIVDNLGYRDNPLLKKVGVPHEYTQEEIEEYIKCSQDPIHFITTYIKIVNVDEGLMPFKMWDFQKTMVETFKDNRFVIMKMPRQVGKTTTTVGYLLWHTIFQDQQNVAILANKGSLARDILAKYQLAYENLPTWLQQGVVTWNKGNVELENGSKIIAASTSSSAIRGGSFNLVFLDEFAFVPNNMAVEFFNSVYPVISSGKTSKIIIVSTPNGMNLFYRMWMDAIEGRSTYKALEIHWSMVPGRDEKWKEETIRNTSEEQFRQEFETEFLGSTNTLISGSKLQMLHYKNPIAQHQDMNIFEHPIKGDDEKTSKDHLYALCVDIAEGKNLDASTFSVIDISTTPYKQVAIYHNRNMSPVLFPTVIYNAARYYNDAYILVEINNTPQVADILHMDFEYENVIKVQTGNKKAQQISAGFGRGIQLGVRMTPLVKRVGCANLKTLIENDKLLVNDFITISELTTFVANKQSFAAEEGANDDMVMTLVLFAWMTTQKYFKDIVSHDIRKQLQLQEFSQVDEELLPIGELDDGRDVPFIVEGGDVWVTGDGDMYASYFDEITKGL
jgi:Terminase large subunit, T4likevirus-type, N-terminal/Terminase RNaseH-like domain